MVSSAHKFNYKLAVSTDHDFPRVLKKDAAAILLEEQQVRMCSRNLGTQVFF